MDIRLNGAPYRAAAGTLSELLAEQKIDVGRRGVAIAVNAALVPRAHWQDTPLRPGDEVEIVRPHSGG